MIAFRTVTKKTFAKSMTMETMMVDRVLVVSAFGDLVVNEGCREMDSE